MINFGEVQRIAAMAKVRVNPSPWEVVLQSDEEKTKEKTKEREKTMKSMGGLEALEALTSEPVGEVDSIGELDALTADLQKSSCSATGYQEPETPVGIVKEVDESTLLGEDAGEVRVAEKSFAEKSFAEERCAELSKSAGLAIPVVNQGREWALAVQKVTAPEELVKVALAPEKPASPKELRKPTTIRKSWVEFTDEADIEMEEFLKAEGLYHE